MNRVAIMVDAGYLFAAGSALISGSARQKRSLITLDEKVTLAALKKLAMEVTHDARLLRIYWYDGAPARIGPSAEHIRLAHSDDVKVRLGFLNSVGEQKGVDSLIVTDLVELARNRAISDAILVSGDEDVRIGVSLAQSYGVRVHLLGIHPARRTQSLQLMQEADTCIEWTREIVRTLMSIRPEEQGAQPPTDTPPSRSMAEIDAVTAELVQPLQPQELRGLAQYLASNRNNLPPEYDGKLLARSRKALGRDLDAGEKRYAREQFRQYVRGD